MVECEYITAVRLLKCICVLIDTWWNVNEVQFDFSRGYYTVLIDTWWNVNFLLAKEEPFA